MMLAVAPHLPALGIWSTHPPWKNSKTKELPRRLRERETLGRLQKRPLARRSRHQRPRADSRQERRARGLVQGYQAGRRRHTHGHRAGPRQSKYSMQVQLRPLHRPLQRQKRRHPQHRQHPQQQPPQRRESQTDGHWWTVMILATRKARWQSAFEGLSGHYWALKALVSLPVYVTLIHPI